MAYQSVQLDSELSIEKIYTIHYYEYQNDFYFSGERHNFWEFQCVDKGSAEIVTDNGSHILNRNQVIFHRPNEFHTLKAAGRTAPNIIVISFSCDSPCMNFFENKASSGASLQRHETVLFRLSIILIWKKWKKKTIFLLAHRSF